MSQIKPATDYMCFLSTDSKGRRPLFCQFVNPLSEEKEPFKKKPFVSFFLTHCLIVTKTALSGIEL